jgi:hypothetical protein
MAVKNLQFHEIMQTAVTQPSQHAGKSLKAPYFTNDGASHFNLHKHEQTNIFENENGKLLCKTL